MQQARMKGRGIPFAFVTLWGGRMSSSLQRRQFRGVMHSAVAVVVEGEVEPLAVFADEAVGIVHAAFRAIGMLEEVVLGPAEVAAVRREADVAVLGPGLALVAAAGHASLVQRRGLGVVTSEPEQQVIFPTTGQRHDRHHGLSPCSEGQ